MLAALARETERIRLATLVSPVTFRHPAVLLTLADPVPATVASMKPTQELSAAS